MNVSSDDSVAKQNTVSTDLVNPDAADRVAAATLSANAELLAVADEVRRAVAPLVSTGVDVFVEDIEPR